MSETVGENKLSRVICCFLSSFAIGMILAPVLIFLFKKIKAKQSILVYVEQHKGKQGVPTMGGIIFIIPTIITFLIFRKGLSELSLFCLISMISYAFIGALDDGIKIVLKRNLGLKAYQKIISQSVIAVLLSYYLYNSPYVGGDIVIPFYETEIQLGLWYYLFCFLCIIATTNAVNLTDGLDGLACKVSLLYIFIFSILICIKGYNKNNLGQTLYAQELLNLGVFCFSLLGGMGAFLWHNAYKANVFMGDTGSLALGGVCCILPLVLKNPLYIVIGGIMFVLSVISVIVQVLIFKLKKKRVFLMAPFHHHMEMKGINESKIVTYYCLITLFFCLVYLVTSL